MKLDSKTKCFLAMLVRMLEIKLSITKSFIDCNQELGTFDLEKQEVDVIRHLVSSLEPVKFGTEKLGDRTSTLSRVEGIFSLILNALDLLNNPISRELHDAIIKKIEQRRYSNLVGMLPYLNRGKNTRDKMRVACQFFITRLH